MRYGVSNISTVARRVLVAEPSSDGANSTSVNHPQEILPEYLDCCTIGPTFADLHATGEERLEPFVGGDQIFDGCHIDAKTILV